VDFRILGPLEIWDDGVAVRVAGDRQRALLAILLLHAGEVVSGDRLMDDLWGDSQPTAGAAALRVRVSQLRKALRDEGDLLASRAHGYVVRIEPDQLDLHRFERLVGEGEQALGAGEPALARERLCDALALWRGAPLADFTYAPFARAAVARLEDLRLAAVELRIEADLALGRHAAVVGELETLVADHSLRERFCAQLMLALYRAGRQAEALAAYRTVRDRLVDEVGIEPGPQLRGLERRILAQDPALEIDEARPVRARTILVMPAGDAQVLASFAQPLADRARDEVLIASLVADAADLPATTAGARAVQERAAALGVTVRVATFVSGDRADDAVRLAAEQDAVLLVLDLPDALLASGAFDEELTTVLNQAVCDVALVAGCNRRGPAHGPVLAPFAGHEQDWAAVELGAWLARSRGLPLRLLGTRADPATERRDASRLLAHASLALQRGLGVHAEPVLVDPGASGILEAAGDAALVVLGLSERWAQEGIGAARLAVARDAGSPVVLVRRGLRPGGLAPPEARTRFTWSAAYAPSAHPELIQQDPPAGSTGNPGREARRFGAQTVTCTLRVCDRATRATYVVRLEPPSGGLGQRQPPLSSCHGVRIRGPSAVMAMVNSKWAARDPSWEKIAQPSSPMRTAWRQALTIGSTARTMPSSSSGPRPGSP
jgi:DNA-binding SARP family transcriptional activator